MIHPLIVYKEKTCWDFLSEWFVDICFFGCNSALFGDDGIGICHTNGIRFKGKLPESETGRFCRKPVLMHTCANIACGTFHLQAFKQSNEQLLEDSPMGNKWHCFAAKQSLYKTTIYPYINPYQTIINPWYILIEHRSSRGGWCPRTQATGVPRDESSVDRRAQMTIPLVPESTKSNLLYPRWMRIVLRWCVSMSSLRFSESLAFYCSCQLVPVSNKMLDPQTNETIHDRMTPTDTFFAAFCSKLLSVASHFSP